MAKINYQTFFKIRRLQRKLSVWFIVYHEPYPMIFTGKRIKFWVKFRVWDFENKFVAEVLCRMIRSGNCSCNQKRPAF